MTYYDPPGIAFFDKASRRVMKLVTDGQFKDWIVYKHPEGQWVSLRKATEDDLKRLKTAGNDTGRPTGRP